MGALRYAGESSFMGRIRYSYVNDTLSQRVTGEVEAGTFGSPEEVKEKTIKQVRKLPFVEDTELMEELAEKIKEDYDISLRRIKRYAVDKEGRTLGISVSYGQRTTVGKRYI